MGAVGSGRWGRRSSRGTTEDYCRLSVWALAKEGLLSPGRRFTIQWLEGRRVVDSVRVEVEAGRLVLDTWCVVRLEHQAWFAGRLKTWFKCPRCFGRCVFLYRASGLGCATCLGLAWQSEREGRYSLEARRARKVMARCRFDFRRPGCKPKWQHWRTFRTLEGDAERVVDRIDVPRERTEAALRRFTERISAPAKKRRSPGRPSSAERAAATHTHCLTAEHELARL